MIFNFRTLSTEQLEKLQREIEAELYERDSMFTRDMAECEGWVHPEEAKDEG